MIIIFLDMLKYQMQIKSIISLTASKAANIYATRRFTVTEIVVTDKTLGIVVNLQQLHWSKSGAVGMKSQLL